MEKVQDAVEEIRGRFGKSAITYACLMGDLKMPTDGRDKVKMPGLMYQSILLNPVGIQLVKKCLRASHKLRAAPVGLPGRRFSIDLKGE